MRPSSDYAEKHIEKGAAEPVTTSRMDDDTLKVALGRLARAKADLQTARFREDQANEAYHRASDATHAARVELGTAERQFDAALAEHYGIPTVVE